MIRYKIGFHLDKASTFKGCCLGQDTALVSPSSRTWNPETSVLTGQPNRMSTPSGSPSYSCSCHMTGRIFERSAPVASAYSEAFSDLSCLTSRSCYDPAEQTSSLQAGFAVCVRGSFVRERLVCISLPFCWGVRTSPADGTGTARTLPQSTQPCSQYRLHYVPCQCVVFCGRPPCEEDTRCCTFSP